MPTLDELRLKTGQLITEDWFDKLVDFLEEVGYGGVITVYGYVSKDLVPVEDLLINLGIPLKNFKELHVGYGYFKYDAWIEGKKILKDGDPITVEDLGSPAQTKITTAIDNSTQLAGIKGDTAHLDINISAFRDAITGKLDVIASKQDQSYSKLTDIDNHLLGQSFIFKPILLDKVINQIAPDMADIFPTDLIVPYAGRIRFKFMAGYEIYAYVKHRPSGTTTDLIAMLNAGASIPPACWHEFDFTVMNNDKINFRITPSTTISLFIYNIPNT